MCKMVKEIGERNTRKKNVAFMSAEYFMCVIKRDSFIPQDTQ